MDYWVTAIIVILIVGITLDGIRRMRIAKREGVQLSRNARKFDRGEEIQVSNSEFPSGGARVAQVRDPDEASNLNQNVRNTFKAKKVTKGAPNRLPEQVSLNLENPVPMLMDSVESSPTDSVGSGDDIGKPRPAVRDEDSEINTRESFKDPLEPSLGSFENLEEGEEPESVEPPLDADNIASNGSEFEYSGRTESSRNEKAQENQHQNSEPTREADYSEPEEVLVMNVMAKTGTRISGADLLNALMNEGLKFGDMDIFHRYKDNDGDGPVIFSLANMVVPGTFNLAEMKNFETPGISIFLSLPVEVESLVAYNDMATTAKNLAYALDADLKDENRSVMTNQTIEHGRQRVVEFERKKKLARA